MIDDVNMDVCIQYSKISLQFKLIIYCYLLDPLQSITIASFNDL